MKVNWIIVSLLIFVVLGLQGCHKEEPKQAVDSQYDGKTFTVEAIFPAGQTARIQTWENATNVSSYMMPEIPYSFKVNGKTVEIFGATSVILTETDKIKP